MTRFAAPPEADLSIAVTTRRRKAGVLTVGLILAVGVLGVVVIASLAFGARPVGLGTALTALLDFDPMSRDHLAVHELRVARTAAGLLVGVALGLAGALMQGVVRNPSAIRACSGWTRVPHSPWSSRSICWASAASRATYGWPSSVRRSRRWWFTHSVQPDAVAPRR